MDRNQQAPSREHFDSQEVGLIEEALGDWDIKYPGPDGLIQEGYSERLELKRDGTYAWDPPPVWAPSTGVWGVIKAQDGLKLCFKDKRGRSRWGYLVLIQMKKDGPFFLNWQRTSRNAVIFADRIWRADRPSSKMA